MANLLGSLLRQATRKDGEPLNILTHCVHESWESNLAKTGHKFYAIRQSPSLKNWELKYRPLPPNYTLLNLDLGPDQIPYDVEFDLILSGHRFGAFQLFSQISRSLHLNLIQVEHTTPMPNWPPQHLEQLKQLKGHCNVFITEHSRSKWGWGEDAIVIKHGIDTDLFKPGGNTEFKRHILSVNNDFKNRDWCLGFSLYLQLTKDLPTFPVGATPGFSEPASSPEELVKFYQESAVFLNTATHSPVPTVLLEAMACGGLCISYPQGMVTEIVQNGVNGFISDNPNQLRKYLEDALNHPKDFGEIRANARKTILEKFSLEYSLSQWNELFYKWANEPYRTL